MSEENEKIAENILIKLYGISDVDNYPDIEKAVIEALDAKDRKYAELQQANGVLFSKLGTAQLERDNAKAELQKAKSALTWADEELSRLKSGKESQMVERIASLEKSLREKEAENEQLKSFEDADAETIQNYYAPILAKKEKIFRIELTAKDHKITALEAELKENREYWDNARKKVITLERHIEVLRGKIKFALEIPESVDYEQDPCGQINKVCEILEEALKGAPCDKCAHDNDDHWLHIDGDYVTKRVQNKCPFCKPKPSEDSNETK